MAALYEVDVFSSHRHCRLDAVPAQDVHAAVASLSAGPVGACNQRDAVIKFTLLSPCATLAASGWIQHSRFHQVADAVLAKGRARTSSFSRKSATIGPGRRQSNALNGSCFTTCAPPAPTSLADRGRARIHDKPAAPSLRCQGRYRRRRPNHQPRRPGNIRQGGVITELVELQLAWRIDAQINGRDGANDGTVQTNKVCPPQSERSRPANNHRHDNSRR